jgi:2-iminobutanoate/2-iminopropanoate deaminase
MRTEPRVQLPLSEARELNGVIYVSGQVGMDDDTGSVPAEFQDEMRSALRNCASALAAHGASLSNVVHARIYLSDANLFPAMNEVYAEFFAPPFPARTSLVTGLPLPSLRVEIDMVAGLP